MSIDIGTLTARIEATVVGFDKTVESISKSLDQLVKVANTTLNKIPQEVSTAVKKAAAEQVSTVRATTSQIDQIRQKLTDREKQLALDSHEYKVHLVKKEAQLMANAIVTIVKDQEQANQLLARLEKVRDTEIENIRAQHHQKLSALAEKELDQVIALRQQLIAREKKASMDSVEYQEFILNQQAQNLKAQIELEITDKKRAASLIAQLEKTLAAEIEAVRKDAFDKNVARINKEMADERKASEERLAAHRRYQAEVHRIERELMNDNMKLTVSEHAFRLHIAEQRMMAQKAHINETIVDEVQKLTLLTIAEQNYQLRVKQMNDAHAEAQAEQHKRLMDQKAAEIAQRIAEQERGANYIFNTEQTLQDRINRLTMTSEQYRIEQVKRRYELEHAEIQKNVEDHVKAAQLIVQAERAALLEIEAIRKEHAPKPVQVKPLSNDREVREAKRKDEEVFRFREEMTNRSLKLQLSETEFAIAQLTKRAVAERKFIEDNIKGEQLRTHMLNQLEHTLWGEIKNLRDAEAQQDKKRKDEEVARAKRAADEKLAKERAYVEMAAKLEEQLEDQTLRLVMNETAYKLVQADKQFEITKNRINKEIKEEERRVKMLEQLEFNYQLERKKIEQTDKDGLKLGGQTTVRGTLQSTAFTSGVGAAALGMHIHNASKAAIEFDRNMRNVDSIAHMTTQQLKQMGDAVLDMSQKFPKTAVDLSSALYEIQSSGFSGQQALDVLEQAAFGASAGLSSTADASRVLIGLMNAYNLKEGPDAIRFMDVLFKTVDEGVVSFDELTHHMSMISAQAAALDVPIEDVGAGIIALTRAGHPAAQAIQELNMFLSKLKDPTVEGAKAAEGMGLGWFKAGQSAKHLREVGLSKVLEEISKATGGNADNIHRLINEMEGERAAFVLLRNGAEEYVEYLDKTKNAAGATAEAFKRQHESYGHQIDILTNTFTRARIVMGSAMMEVIIPLAHALTKLVNAFLMLPGPVQKFLAATIIAMFGVLALVSALSLLGYAAVGVQLGLGVASPALASLGLIASGTTLTLKGLAGVILGLMGTIALWVGGAAVAAAALYAVWQLNLGGVRDTFTELGSYIPKFWGETNDKVTAKTKQTGRQHNEVWEQIKGATAVILASIDTLLRGYFGLFSEIITTFTVFVTMGWGEMVNYITRTWGSGFVTMYERATRVIGALGEFLKSTFDNFGKMFQGFAEAAMTPWDPDAGINKMHKAFDRIGWKAQQTGAIVQSEMFGALADVAGGMEGIANNYVSKVAEFKLTLDKIKMPNLGGSPSVPLQDPNLPKTRGIEHTEGGNTPSERQLRQEILMTRKLIEARNLSHEQAIALFEDFNKKYDLNERQKILIDREIAIHKKKMEKEAEREGRAATTASNRAAREAAQEASQQFKNEYSRRLNTAKQFHRDSYAAEQEAIQDEIQLISGMRARATNDAERRMVDSRLATLRASLVKMADEKKAADAKLDAEIRQAQEQREDDSLDKKLRGIRAHYQKIIVEAIKHGADIKKLNAIAKEYDKDVAKAKLEDLNKLRTERESLEENTLSKQLATLEKNHEEQRKKYANHKEHLAEIDKIYDLRRTQIIEDHNRKTMSAWKQGLDSAFSMLSSIADPTKNVWDRLGAAMNAVGTIFEKQIAAVVVPYLDKMTIALAQGGIPAVLQLANAWVQVGIDAVAAAAKSAAMWLVGLGPGGWIVAVLIGVAAIGMAFTSAFAEAERRQAALKKEAEDWARAMEAIYARVSGNKVRMAQSEYDNSVNSIYDDEKVKELNNKVYNLKALIQSLDVSADTKGQKAAYQQELAVAEQRLNELVAAKNVEAAKKLEDDLAAIRDAGYQLRMGNLLSSAKRSGDEESAIRLDAEAKLQTKILEIRDQYKAGMFQSDKEYFDALAGATADSAAEVNKSLFEMKEKAMLATQDAKDSMFGFQQSLSRMDNDLALNSGSITPEAHMSKMFELDKAAITRQSERLQSELDFYTESLNAQQLTAEQKIAIEEKMNNTLKKMNDFMANGLQKQIDDYKKKVEQKYKDVQDDLQDKRDAIEVLQDAELAAHEQTMRNLEEQERPLKRQLELYQQMADAIKNRYETERAEVNAEDKTKFDAALSTMTLGDADAANLAKITALRAELATAIAEGRDGQADLIRQEIGDIQNLTFEILDIRKQEAENLYGLEEGVTPEQHAAKLQNIALLKAKLAQKELADSQISYRERVRIQTTLKEAYEEWREAQINLLDEQEQKELDVVSAQERQVQTQLDGIAVQKRETQYLIDDIKAKYKVMFDAIDLQIKNNKQAWADALYAIKTGTDTTVQSITEGWRAVRNSIEDAIAAKNRYSGSSGGSSYSYTGATGTVSGTSGASYSTKYFARGGWARGGKRGVDSIPAMLQDGEHVTDVSLSAGLVEMVSYFRSMVAGGINPIGAFSGGTQINIMFKDPVVREEADFDRLTEEVSTRIARQY